MKDGGWAFPCYTGNDMAEPGMTMRDYFAGQALAGMSSDISWYENIEWQRAAVVAYGLADAMLAKREKEAQ